MPPKRKLVCVTFFARAITHARQAVKFILTPTDNFLPDHLTGSYRLLGHTAITTVHTTRLLQCYISPLPNVLLPRSTK